jgi:hypothetical protein
MAINMEGYDWIDEVLEVSEDSNIPKYIIRDKEGSIIQDDVSIELKTPVLEEATPLNRANLQNAEEHSTKIGEIRCFSDEVVNDKYLECNGGIIGIQYYPLISDNLQKEGEDDYSLVYKDANSNLTDVKSNIFFWKDKYWFAPSSIVANSRLNEIWYTSDFINIFKVNIPLSANYVFFEMKLVGNQLYCINSDYFIKINDDGTSEVLLERSEFLGINSFLSFDGDENGNIVIIGNHYVGSGNPYTLAVVSSSDYGLTWQSEIAADSDGGWAQFDFIGSKGVTSTYFTTQQLNDIKYYDGKFYIKTCTYSSTTSSATIALLRRDGFKNYSILLGKNDGILSTEQVTASTSTPIFVNNSIVRIVAGQSGSLGKIISYKNTNNSLSVINTASSLPVAMTGEQPVYVKDDIAYLRKVASANWAILDSNGLVSTAENVIDSSLEFTANSDSCVFAIFGDVTLVIGNPKAEAMCLFVKGIDYLRRLPNLESRSTEKYYIKVKE